MKKNALKVKSMVKAGKIGANHTRASLKVKSKLKAGKIGTNHSRVLL